MAKCNNCGKELPEDTILKVGENAFCNDLCKQSYGGK
jgi:hypothetical protein